MSASRIIALTTAAMLAFAANSVLARLAFATGDAEPFGYTGIRLAAGAVTLALLLLWRNRTLGRISGSWAGAGALFGYAFFFSVAYVVLGAGMGALILFASVQIGVIGWAIFRGDRPGALEWLGLAVAFGALVYLVSPGLVAPDPWGATMMAIAGFSWAAYTLIGRGSQAPLSDTAGNFIRCLPLAVALVIAGAAMHGITLTTAVYAVASGAIASGLGYAIWYAVLPALTRTRAAIVQLTVPAIAAAGGVMLIGEPLTLRLVAASAGIIGGVAIAMLAAERRRMSS